MDRVIVGMHQPNMMPWIGYFYKIFQSDIFIFVDDVQFIKSGSSYTNTIRLNERGKPIKLTIPIKRVSGKTENINEIIYAKNNWQRKIIRSLELNYAKCDFYKNNRDFIFELIEKECSNYSEYNIHSIQEISKKLELETEFKISSKIEKRDVKSATDRIVKLAKEVNASHFISGRGGDNYQNHDLYRENKIELIYSDFIDFEYKQYRTEFFVKGLSIIDAIFNIGFDNLKLHFEEIKNDSSKLSF
jgi:hypothetical protein